MRQPKTICLIAGTLPAVATMLWMACYGQSLSSSKKHAESNATVGEWSSYGGDPGGSRFSPLAQINRTDVQQLKIAWIYHTGDVSDGAKHPRRSGFETTPIVVDGTLYLSTAFNRVIAVDPETGGSPEDFPYFESLHQSSLDGDFGPPFEYALKKYRKDSNPKDPNLAPREFWPSTLAYRNILYRAGKRLGQDASAYLGAVPDSDLRLFAHIE